MYQAFWKNTTEDFMYCQCPEKFYGLHCEVKSESCGDHHCFNGGNCVKVNGRHRCNCSAATTNETMYAGRFCQFESTAFCDKKNGPNGQAFCTNGGLCKVDTNGVAYCQCPAGYHGPICEFHDEEDNGDYENCTLDCQNNGVCRKGVKDVSFLNKFNLGAVDSNLNKTHNEDFEHCVCPLGFVGHSCEMEVDTCGDSSHICLHGSKCVEDGDGHTCDCSDSFTTFDKFAGKHCQHKATQFCTKSGELGVGKDNLSFCVNNGQCVDPKDGE